MVLEKTLESPLHCKKIQPVHRKGNQSWILTGRTDAEAETPILWPPDAKNWLIWKNPDAGKDWRQEEKGTTEDEMIGWHHQLNGHESEQAPGVGDGQGTLACFRPWGHKDWPDWETELMPHGSLITAFAQSRATKLYRRSQPTCSFASLGNLNTLTDLIFSWI